MLWRKHVIQVVTALGPMCIPHQQIINHWVQSLVYKLSFDRPEGHAVSQLNCLQEHSKVENWQSTGIPEIEIWVYPTTVYPQGNAMATDLSYYSAYLITCLCTRKHHSNWL